MLLFRQVLSKIDKYRHIFYFNVSLIDKFSVKLTNIVTHFILGYTLYENYT